MFDFNQCTAVSFRGDSVLFSLTLVWQNGFLHRFLATSCQFDLRLIFNNYNRSIMLINCLCHRHGSACSISKLTVDTLLMRIDRCCVSLASNLWDINFSYQAFISLDTCCCVANVHFICSLRHVEASQLSAWWIFFEWEPSFIFLLYRLILLWNLHALNNIDILRVE